MFDWLSPNISNGNQPEIRSKSITNGFNLTMPFRRIIPRQAQRLLDQVTVLAAGEAIVFGSAVHVPGRVQIKLPSQEPWSATAAPFLDWKQEDVFPLAEVIEQWGLGDDDQAPEQDDIQPTTPIEGDNTGDAVVVETDDDLDDEIPF